MSHPLDLSGLRSALEIGAPEFWQHFRRATLAASTPSDLLTLSRFATRAEKNGMLPEKRSVVRILLLGAVTFSPWADFLRTSLKADGIFADVTIGEFDNYLSEILSGQFGKFDVVFLFPSRHRALYANDLLDREKALAALAQRTQEILGLCEKAHQMTGGEIVLANFLPNPHSDLGPLGAKVLGSESTFLRHLNLNLGLAAPSYVTILDCDGVASRLGLKRAVDPRGWLESRQPGSPEYLLVLAREAHHVVRSFKVASKKVLVLDLDNTLWGGVIGDDGLQGIELGDTSPRSEAFKSFQKSIRKLKERGVLLAVCSKNELAAAELPFREHPEMVLKLEDIVSFKANWKPKPDNIVEIATELNLGLDSFVFVDDNPAEIEIVRQTLPLVETILLDADPSQFISQLENSRFFEPRLLTNEDGARTEQYRQEGDRQKLLGTATNLDEYLTSIEMEAEVSRFEETNFPRISQLINKSNQFNLTTRRRSLAEVAAVAIAPDHVGLSIRLRDKFGDYGIISTLIGRMHGTDFHIDTWLMSCRVLQRGVERLALDEIVKAARKLGADRIIGEFIRSPKNKLVEFHYDSLDFVLKDETPSEKRYELALGDYVSKPVSIKVIGSPNEHR